MHYVIYLDVLFVVNFIMDYTVLSITAWILQHTTTLPANGSCKDFLITYIRRISGAVIGALWACAMMGFGLINPAWNIVTYLLVGPLMVLFIVGIKDFKAIMKGIGILYIVTFVLGGLLHVIYYYTTFGYFIHTLVSAKGDNPGLWLIVAGSIPGYALIRWLVVFIQSGKNTIEARYTVIIENDGIRVKLPALCDTGNGLHDPVFNGAVNIVEASAVMELITSYEKMSFHLIPYSSIGTERGMIPVIRVNKLIIIGRKETKIVNNPLFALYSGKFSAKSGYKVILHPDVVNGITD